MRSPLVGRGQQLATLSDVVARAIDFQAPQLVTVVGNQGTGKTRLIQELIPVLAQKHDQGCRVYHGAAERDGAGKPVPHAALTSLLRDRFELLPVTDEASRLRFAHEVRTVMGPDEAVEMLHFVGGFIGLDYPPTPFLRAVTENPRHHGQIARIALRRFIEVDAAHSPLVLVLDDMQWADSDTLALVGEIIGGLAGSPVVLLTAARPDMLVHASGWGEGAVDHERIDLRNLEPDDAEQMFKNLLARVPSIPDETAQAAVEMTGGNPAFLEQLVRLFLDNGTIDTRKPVWTLDPDKAAETELPVSIEEAIEARIAALEGEERDLLEKAAVFGNVFWVSAVIALTRLEKAAQPVAAAPLDIEWGNGEDVRRRVSDLMALLAERDYLLPLDPADSTLPGDVEVVFKHNLERELIVRSTEVSRRARYYLSAAQWLEAKTVQRSDEQLVRLFLDNGTIDTRKPVWTLDPDKAAETEL
ncbi:MAG TPA: AAA family ATPase, partial [Kofleriaceae bacterium]|nr:AAA family ATPase [Kofleriaceae bacterium]